MIAFGLIAPPAQAGTPLIASKVDVTQSGSYAIEQVSGKIYTWGDPQYLTPINTHYDHAVPLPSAISAQIGTATNVLGGGNHACAISGLIPFIKVTCWGDNSEYTTSASRWFSTGHPTAVSVYESSTPNFFSFPLTGPGSIPAFTRGDIGYNHNCVIGNSGIDVGKVFCWGGNQKDQTRGIAGLHTAAPVQVNLNAGTVTNTALKVAAGGDQTCAIVKPSNAPTAQKVMCWSSNPFMTGTSPTPLPYISYALNVAPFPYAREITSQAEITDAADISSGNYGNCMIRSTKNNGMWCWGDATHYGSGYVSPVQAPLDMNVKKMTLGAWHSCGLKTDGKVYCFGANNHGQLGNGNNANNINHATPPTQVIFPNGTVIRDISSKHAHTCAVADTPTLLGGAAKDTVWCWGNHMQKQLGDCTVASTGKNIPVQVMTSCGPPPNANGVCNSATMGGTFSNPGPSATPPTNLCTSGTPTAVTLQTANPYNWLWSCQGVGTGTTASCFARNVPGKCGSADMGNFTSSTIPPAGALCATGNPITAPVSSGGTWTWSCSGAPVVSCSAKDDTVAPRVDGTCGLGSGSPTDASIAAIPTPYCSSGTPSPTIPVLNNAGNWAPWSCVGANGGATVQCGTKILQQPKIGVFPSAGNGCSISPSTNTILGSGMTATFTATAAAGYFVGTTTGTCPGLPTLTNPVTIGPINTSCTIKANCYNCNPANGPVSSYCVGVANPLELKTIKKR